jgi:hypothetical protein
MNGIWVKENGDLEEARGVKKFGHIACEWTTPYGTVSLFTKSNSAGVNQYEFPPPVDSKTYVGDCFLSAGKHPLTIAEWTVVYDSLVQSIDIEHTDDEEEEEEEEEDRTRHGYLKDGFVISDDELDEVAYE